MPKKEDYIFTKQAALPPIDRNKPMPTKCYSFKPIPGVKQPQEPVFSTDDLLSADFPEQVMELLYESVATQSTDEVIAETNSKVTREQRQEFIKNIIKRLKKHSKLKKVNLKKHLEVLKSKTHTE